MDSLRIPLKKKQCSHCSTPSEILEIVRGGSKVVSAPCKKCNHENQISSETWERGPAEVDLLNDREVIQYFRDLFNLADLLENGLNMEILIFIRKLRGAGYTDDRIQRFITYAGYNSRFEYLTNGNGKKLVPRPLPEQGDWKEWLRAR